MAQRVAVVGGGVVGSSIAYFLVHLIGFYRVTLLAESQDSVTRMTAMVASAYGTT